MKDNVVLVNLWDKNVGLLSWDDKRRRSVFNSTRILFNMVGILHHW